MTSGTGTGTGLVAQKTFGFGPGSNNSNKTQTKHFGFLGPFFFQKEKILAAALILCS
jgi:hypothetical protein